MTVAPIANATELIAAAIEANLADVLRLEEFTEGHTNPESSSAQVVADELVARGILTPFQVNQLLAGKRRGFVLGGKYRVLDLLGVGGMGQVLLCEHLRLRSLAAVKVLPPDRLVDPAAVERFYREARASAALRNEHIVRAYDLDTDGEFHFLAMEFVHGVSLQQLVLRSGPLGISRAVEYARQAAIGLGRVHAAGLVHRDIKPGNIMVDWKGTVTLLDLGLARFTLDHTDDLTDRLDEGAVLGTADYIAPEQADASSQADVRADLYGLGFTLYYLLVGSPPFAEGTPAQKVLWHKTRTVDLRAARPDIPTGLANVFDRLTAKDPADRFQIPDAAAAALAEWVSEPVYPPSTDELPNLCPLVHRLLGSNTSTGPITPPHTARPQVRSGTTNRAAVGTSPQFRWKVLAAGLGLAVVGAAAAVAIAGRDFLVLPSDFPTAPRPGSFPDPMTGVDENPDKPIEADLAVSRVGQKRKVLVLVKFAERTANGIYLYSDTDPTSPKNFTVLIPTAAIDRFQENSIRDPMEFYFRTTIYVTGHIVLLDGKKMPGIRVEDPAQIEPFRPAGQ